ncbi:MAG: polysaccharide biosynthesis C-terminal domain-containing protein [Actinomycetia bacterium]|nr:polysaccharide biosynthesis C-terminal domain-containing protein [Actinomycetes bacterium]
MSEPHPPTHLHRIGRGGTQNVAAAAVAAALGIALSVVVARSFSETDTGRYFAATSVVLLVASITRLGTSIGLVYWVARLRELGRGQELRALLAIALRPALALSVVGGVMMFAAAPLASDVLFDGGTTGAELLRILALALPAIVIFDAILGASRGLGTMTPSAVLDRIMRPAAQLVLTVGAVATGGIVAVTAAWALPYVALVVIAGVWLHKRTVGDYSPAAPGLRGEFWRFTWPRAITSVVQQARQRFDIVLVAAIRGPAEAAIYAIATRFLVVGQLTNSALALAAQPQVASLSATDRKAAIASLYRSTTTWIILLNGPLYIGVAIFSPLLLSIFGDAYISAWPVTVTLCIAAFIGNGSGMVDVMLSMTGRTGATLGNSLGALATQVVLIVALVPTWGAFGAAVAWGTSIVVINALSVIQLARSDGIHPFEKGTAYAVLANALAVALPAGVIAVVMGQTWVAFCFSVVLCALAYTAFARLVRTQLHLSELAEALGRRRT